MDRHSVRQTEEREKNPETSSETGNGRAIARARASESASLGSLEDKL